MSEPHISPSDEVEDPIDPIGIDRDARTVNSGEREKIYIVLSQTGTALSRILKLITHAPYNHSSIALDEDLHAMYSFGRANPYNPFIGAFVEESPTAGTFKRFKNTRVMVLEFEVSPEKRDELSHVLGEMLRERARYHYNYLGLFLAAVRVHREKQNCYYCSEFVKAMAQKLGLDGVEKIPPIVKPVHFLNLAHKTIYVGKLKDYIPTMRPAHSRG